MNGQNSHCFRSGKYVYVPDGNERVFLCCGVVSFELEAFHASCMPKIGVHVHKFYVNGRCNLMLTAVYIVAQSRLIQMSRFLAVF